MKRNIENMYIWRESRVLVNIVYGMMEKCHDYNFKDQIQRASLSVMNNIAEGAEIDYISNNKKK